MKLDFIDLGKLSISKTNMRYAKKAPDVADILPTVRARGVLVPLIVRPNCAEGAFEIVAGARRFTAATIIAGERGEADPLPCAILEEGDNAAALEASLIENVARRDADEVTQWVTYTRLVREGRSIADISDTFGMPEAMVKRILALGNLLPRIRSLYAKEKISAGTVRHLTMAAKSQQRAWLALFDDADAYCPQGQQLKNWLFGGGAISVAHSLFDIEASGLAIIADLFGDERYFADSDAFWTAQLAAVEERRARFLDAGWNEVVVLPKGDYFREWEHRPAAKRKGGRIYIEVRDSGEVDIHEGYVTAKEAARLEKGEKIEAAPKASRPELTARMQTYVDLHRHAAVRAELTGHPAVALRLMVAHAIAGSPLWNVRVEPQSAKDDDVRESIEVSRAEAVFDEKRRAVLALLGFDAEEPTVAGGNPMPLADLFQRLLDLPDRAVMDVIAIVMGETLVAGSAAVEAVGLPIGIDMAAWWGADDAFFAGLRDKEVLTALVAEVGGNEVAAANAREKSATLKAIVRDHLDGSNGRAKVEGWVPRWMAFPAAAYTERGGVDVMVEDSEATIQKTEEEPQRKAA
ncbi:MULTISPECIES: ParB/RepB/Spo0J family partition protein [unclassified Sphingopyxis]|uniref:ParB/RepB/Spo0J family partition protein n=1 Tax=unclassified Sphingopyxis TaxID=2614943 RepID=UPI00073026F6|nr:MULTISPECIES: ParB/RepB/Spo0J family partition protein [unclassified Sphingopyxis]KTE27086.1 chromosome partitioning protein ParB [Sphingopyxis sp. H057]KTE54392.1 chromosome partitioning protein ParB [Sphingopyxis sp. H073]KTE56714.1 chromosome partitioning protein ParB [Sphingopyxis sp. H071]KTE57859.1 chromosome partitioning protein ParB [Sphingopyxis sp. H107]KTE68165.1 chromosome partitioning protein ParB [Sphingopyxis sp. H100]